MFACLFSIYDHPNAFFRHLKNCMFRLVPLRKSRAGATFAPARLAVWALACLLPLAGVGQQSIAFQADGKTYRAEISWTVKHAGNSYQSASAHTLDSQKDPAFDLEVQFRFADDQVPPDDDIVWGFQFRHAGDLLAPNTGEKRARGLRQFQRFQAVAPGNATLTISPKIWRRSAEARFEVVGQSAPFTLGFSSINGTPVPQPTTAAPPAQPATQPAKPAPQPTAATTTTPLPGETEAYAKAANEPDTSLRIKALLNFIDQHRASGTAAPLVAKALKEVPLGTSLPKSTGPGTVAYTLDYAVKPVVDSAKGWQHKITETGNGGFSLTLSNLGDTAQAIQIADIGKNPPFNRPRTLRPFEKTQVTLVGQSRDSFRIQVAGGIPPFIVYLSQNNVTRVRYVLSETDTTWAFPKDQCTACKSGPHTLEVYTSDFSTLLLRAESSIRIFKIDYYALALYTMLSVLIVYFAYKPIQRAWRQYQYKRKLRDIESWERELEKQRRR